MTMKLGLFHPSYTIDVQESETAKSLGDLARRAENCGFDSFWLMDHVYQVEPQGSIPQPVLDSWTTLGALSTVTSKIKLGTLVTANPFRHPALLSKISSTVDVLSNGRLFMGLGAGWHLEEARAYGIPFPSVDQRLGRLEEAVQIILKMWTEERVNFLGEFYKIQDAYCNPKPVQKPHPPLLVGGGGEKKTLKIVAKYADACNLSGPPEMVIRKLDALRKHCFIVNREFSSILKTHLINPFIYRDEGEARKNAIAALKGMAQERFDQYALFGTPQQILQRIIALVDAGFEYLMVHFEPGREMEALELFVNEVATKL
ncbi:MAG: LLM class F420-dependent oxidoreductase [Nitrososphaerales archaeon]